MTALAELLQPLGWVDDPTRRIYWMALLAALAVASLVTAFRAGRFDVRGQLKAVFDRRYWLQRDTGVDVAMLFSNHVVRVLLLVPLFGSHLALAIGVGGWLQGTFGDSPSPDWARWQVACVFTLVFFVAEDASRCFLHFAMHRVPLLWRLHRLHHSAETLTPLTLFRVHPVEAAMYYVRGAIVFALVSGAFIWLFGGKLSGWQILGVDALGFLFNMAAANLRHSHVWVSFGPLERFFVSPAQHQLHHSRDHAHANLGTCLAVWDQLLGTWSRAGARPTGTVRFGLAPG